MYDISLIGYVYTRMLSEIVRNKMWSRSYLSVIDTFKSTYRFLSQPEGTSTNSVIKITEIYQII